MLSIFSGTLKTNFEAKYKLSLNEKYLKKILMWIYFLIYRLTNKYINIFYIQHFSKTCSYSCQRKCSVSKLKKFCFLDVFHCKEQDLIGWATKKLEAKWKYFGFLKFFRFLISTLQVASSFRALGGFSSANKNRKTLNLKVQTTRKKNEVKTDHVNVYKKLKQAGRIKKR